MGRQLGKEKTSIKGPLAKTIILFELLLLAVIVLIIISSAWFLSNDTVKQTVLSTGQVDYQLIGKTEDIFFTSFEDQKDYEEDYKNPGGTIASPTKPTVGGISYVPGNTELLKNKWAYYNLSTVPSKLRVIVKWEYSPLTDEPNASRAGITISELVSNGAIKENTPVRITQNDTAPLVVTFATAPGIGANAAAVTPWQNVTSGPFTMTDSKNVCWNITKIDKEVTDYGKISKTQIDGAEAVFYYGMTPYGGQSEKDYGDGIPQAVELDSNGNIVQSTISQSAIGILDSIVIQENYTAYSVMKKFSVTVTVQARQASFFEVGKKNIPWYADFFKLFSGNDGWFDVLTVTGNPKP